MRIARPWLAVVCLVAPLFTGCSSTGSSFALKSPSWWPWGKKDPATESSVASTQPTLPSQAANPALASSYGVPGSGTNPYGAPTGSAVAAPGGYSPYLPPSTQTSGAGLYDTQPASYAAAANPAATGGYPMADPAGGNTALQGQYYNPDYARASTPDSYAYPQAPSTPMYPDYNTMGGQAAAPPSSSGMSSNPYAMPSDPAAAYPQAPTYTADARGGMTPPASSPVPGAPAGGSYPQAPDYSMPGAQGYGAPAASPAPNTGYTADPSGFTPGNTGYTPGNTGYAPPAATPYQSPAGTYQPPQGRSDAPYRPGGTSDYPRASTTASPSTTADATTPSAVAPASYNELMPETAPLHPGAPAAQ